MTSSFQVRIHILSREVGYLFWVWMNSEKSYDKSSKQVKIKLSLAYIFRKMFFIGQNLKHVHMTYSFLELLINSCQRNIVCEWIQTSWETNHESKANIFWPASNIDVEKTVFNVKLTSLWIIFTNTYSETAVCKYSSK